MADQPRQSLQAQRSDEVMIVGECPGAFRTGMLQNITCTAWYGRLDGRSAEALVHVTRDVMTRLRGVRGSSVHLLDPSIGFPESSARECLAALSRESVGHLACVCVVLHGDGFWASAIRGFLTGMHTIAPNMFDIRASATTDQVLAFLPAEHRKRTGVQVTPEALHRLLESGQRWRSEKGVELRARA